jgi:hypothetical protein
MPLFHFLEGLGRYAYFALRALAAVPSALARPRDLQEQLHQILLGALPLGIVAGLALGAVIWLHPWPWPSCWSLPRPAPGSSSPAAPGPAWAPSWARCA